MHVSHPIVITAAYAFFPIQKSLLPALRAELKLFGSEREMKGLVLLAEEGLNSTVCGSTEAIDAWKEKLKSLDPSIIFKDSRAPATVFKRWSVKIKPEIVALKDTTVHPHGKHRHLSPEEWDAMLSRDDVVVIDTRNDYEVQIGKFHGAVNPEIDRFSDFPAFLRESRIPKDRNLLLYCTGGIRCEKAIYAAEHEGYQNVYQLDGGILRYLQERPEGTFEGECFVFDKRVAVDAHLRPSQQYHLCPCCGDPIPVATQRCVTASMSTD